MHDRAEVDAALALFRGGVAVNAISRTLGIPPTTVWHWCRDRRAESVADDSRRVRCPRCHGLALDEQQYAYLLGQYLGDGHISVGRRGVASLSIACADEWLFPQHGPGHKHERAIVLSSWQDEVVRDHPGRLLRGLIHSDGCRIVNWARPRRDGKRYEYPRYWFSNHSTDILDICCRALDDVGVEHRRPRWNAVPVAKKDSVARLDEFVGPKY